MANFDGHKQKIGSVTVLRTGWLNDRGSIPSTGKSYFYFRKFPERFRDLNSIISYVCRGFFSGLNLPGVYLNFWASQPFHWQRRRKILHLHSSFIHSIGMCRMRRFLAVLRSFFHSSLLCTFSHHPSPPTILQSSLTSSCHVFLGPSLNLDVPKFIYNTLLGILFSSILCNAQINLIYFFTFCWPCISVYLSQ